MITMELDAFIQYARLPEGFYFYDFAGGNYSVKPHGEYLETLMCAIQRDSTKALAYIPIYRLQITATRGVVSVDIQQLSAAVEKAIQELS